MGRKHYREELIAFALRRHDSGAAVAEIIRKLEISGVAPCVDRSLRQCSPTFIQRGRHEYDARHLASLRMASI